MKNILVTGGAGFIGSHTVVELTTAGYRAVLVDNFSNSDRKVIKSLKSLTSQVISCWEGDYQDKSFLKKVLAEERIDGVIHFAAYKAVGESVDFPLKYYQNNVAGLVNLLEFLEDHKISNFVFSSSCTVYGESKKLPLSEDMPTKTAESPYGATKQMSETIIKDTAAASRNFKAISLRYFNPIGAHPTGLIGELPLGRPTILVPNITQAVAGWRDKLTVHGNDYPNPDGTCIRDYIHVVDLARAHVAALKLLAKKDAGYYYIFNIGTGKGSSVMQVIKTFEKVTGQKVPFKIGPRREGDIITSYASADKAKKLLGWQAELSLEDALADAWRWQQTLSKRKQ